VGNPVANRSVKQYLACVREEQLKAHVVPQQAHPVFVTDLEVLSDLWEKMLRDTSLSASQTFIVARNQAFFKMLFFSADRAADLLGVCTPTILRSPDNSGFLFKQVWTKSLSSGEANIFALKRGTNQLICPVRGLELYFSICQALSINISRGYLFRRVSKEALVTAGALEASAAQQRLNNYVGQLQNLSRNHFTLHCFRSGATISMALMDVDLTEMKDHVGWKSSRTALHYKTATRG